MADAHAVHNGYCATQPQPGTLMTAPCPDCGHTAILHVGAEHCPVCEMVDLNRQMRANQTPEADAPEPGSLVHYRHPVSSTACLDAWIASTEEDGTSTITFPGGMGRRGVAEDQTGRGSDTWHSPCNGHDEPEPDGGNPVINITVNGSILSERDLADTIRRVMWHDGLKDFRR